MKSLKLKKKKRKYLGFRDAE